MKLRLDGPKPLEEKLTLAVNLLRSRLTVPRKETVVLDWFCTYMGDKYTTDSWKKAELDNFWASFLVCLEIVDKLDKVLVFKADFLLNIVQHLDLSKPTVERAVNLLLKLTYRCNPGYPNILNLISSLMEKDQSGALSPTVLQIMEKIFLNSEYVPDLETGPLLARLSSKFESVENEALERIIRKVLFSQLQGFQTLFQNISSPTPAKLSSTPEVDVLIDYLNHGGDISTVLGSLRNETYPCWLRSSLFALAVNLQGYECIFNQKSVSLAQLKLKANQSSSILRRILVRALPLDPADQLEDVKVGTILTGVVKFSIQKYGLCVDVCDLISAVYSHHPLVLEPLVSYVLAKYLQDHQAPRLVLETVLELMLKLRQLPKMVSKLLLSLRAGGVEGAAWREEDLVLFGEAVSKVTLKLYVCILHFAS